MNKFKDVIYNISDVLVALLILIVASLIILWRMNAVLAYPETVLRNSSDYVVTEDTSLLDETEVVVEEENPLFVNSLTTRTVEVTIEVGDYAGEAVDRMVSLGLFDSYSEYEKICESLNRDPESIKAGTFTYPIGTSKEEIVLSFNIGG